MQSFPIKKSFFQRTTTSTSHYIKANEQLQILSATTYCELAVQQLFFEKYQSCVCTTVTLSHRFKAFTPAFCRQNRFRHEPPKNFANSLPAELWIVGRRASPRVLFGYFLPGAKSDNPYSFAGSSEVSQTSKQRTAMAASHRNNSNLFKKNFEVLQTSKQRTKITNSD